MEERITKPYYDIGIFSIITIFWHYLNKCQGIQFFPIALSPPKDFIQGCPAAEHYSEFVFDKGITVILGLTYFSWIRFGIET